MEKEGTKKEEVSKKKKQGKEASYTKKREIMTIN